MMILLTGGSGCGKSSFAERLCMERPLPRYYIADDAAGMRLQLDGE